jgi:hypothetical protein
MYEFTVDGVEYRAYWMGSYWEVMEVKPAPEQRSTFKLHEKFGEDAGEGRVKAEAKRRIRNQRSAADFRMRAIKRTAKRIRWQNQSKAVDLADIGIHIKGLVHTLRHRHQKRFFIHVAEIIHENGLEAAEAEYPELALS